jgi:hypothetical protein
VCRERISIDLVHQHKPWPLRPPLCDVVEALVEEDEEFEGWLL